MKRRNNGSFELEVKTITSHFGLLMPLNQQATKGFSVLAGMIDSGYQGDIGLLLHKEVMKSISGIQEVP